MTITPEQFMTWTEPDEDVYAAPAYDFDPAVWQAANPGLPVQMAPAVPDEVQHALRFILDRIKQQDVDTEALFTLGEELEDMRAEYDATVQLLEQIETIIKPSTSKLANQVRAAIKEWRAPEVPAEPVVAGGGHVPRPEHDADVEVWREYASTVNGSLDFSTMNRSQIRTALGIEQPGAE